MSKVMIVLDLFVFVTYSLSKQAPFLDILPGEWDIVTGSQKFRKNAFNPYSAEFHIAPQSSSIYGSIWRNFNTTNSMLDLEDAEVAQLEIDFIGPFSGSIYNLQPTKKLMTQFDFKPTNFGRSLMALGKINDEYSFQLTITNGTIFQIFVTSTKSSEVSEYYAQRIAKLSSTKAKYLKIGIYACIILVTIQVLLWMLLKYCKSRIDNKITQQQENTVIDLDKYSEYLKNQMKAKND